MTIMVLVSLCIGIIGGAVHGLIAHQYNKALMAGEIVNKFSVRTGIIFFRMAMTFFAMAFVLWTGLFAPLPVGVGVALGFIGFNVVYAVKKWM